MSERVWIWLAWHLPRRLVYWCAIRVGTHEPQGLTPEEFARWEFCGERKFRDGLQLWDR
jgi:hypothetical protein